MKIKKVYLGRKQIYPDVPSIEKDAYFYWELEGNTDDATWNNRIGTSSNITYDTDWNLTVANFTNNSEIYLADSMTQSGTTCSFWCRIKPTTIQSNVLYHIMWRANTANKKTFSENILNQNNTLWWYYYDGQERRMNYWWISTDTRYHVFFIRDLENRIAKFFVNWTLVETKTNVSSTWWCNAIFVSWKIWGSSTTNSSFLWKISKVIYLTKACADQEITDYFNKTKENYWL